MSVKGFNQSCQLIIGKQILEGQISFQLGSEMVKICIAEDYYIENLELKQHWDIEEETFKKYGNPYKFAFTGFDKEITNFKLNFTVPGFYANENEIQNLFITVEYTGVNESHILKLGESIVEKDSIEGVFDQLKKLWAKANKPLRACTTCKLADYERGGSALFCFQKDKKRLLDDPATYNYQTWYGDLKRDDTLEFFICENYIS